MLRSTRSAARAVGIALVALFGCGEIDRTCPTCPVEPPVKPPPSEFWTLGPAYPMTDVAVGPNGVYVSGQVLKVTCADCSPPLMVPTDSDFVAKFGFDGKKQWVVTTKTQVRDLDADGERVYVCRMPSVNFVEALDEKTGALLWSTPIGGGMCTDIDVSGDKAYVVTLSYLFELDVSNGSVTASLESDALSGVQATVFFHGVDGSSGTVYVSGSTVKNLSTKEDVPEGTDLFILSVERGLENRKWVRQWRGSPPFVYYARIAVAPGANAIYVAGFSGGLPPDVTSTLTAYDLEGKFMWSAVTDLGLPNHITSNGRDAFVAMLSESEPLRRVRPNGSTMWIASPKVNTLDVAVGDGIVYAITDDGFRRYDAATGVLKQ